MVRPMSAVEEPDKGDAAAVRAPDEPPPNPWIRGVGIALALGAFLFLSQYPTALTSIPGSGKRPAYAAATAALMAVLWLFEAIPIAVTACLPLILYPLLGVYGQGPAGDLKKAFAPFTDAYIVLFFG